jgi:hypothetical protein
MTKDEGNEADACLPVGRGVFQQPLNYCLQLRGTPANDAFRSSSFS